MAIDVDAMEAVTTSNDSVFDFNEPVTTPSGEEEQDDGMLDETKGEEETSEEVEPDASSDPEESSDSEEPEEAPQETAPVITRKKPFHIETKDGASKLPPDTLLSLKENGKISKVPLADAVDAWNSREENQKTFFALSEKEKEVSSKVAKIQQELGSKLETQEYQINTFNDVIKNFHSSAKNGQALVGLTALLEAVDLNALEVVREIRNQLIDSAENYLSLTPAERKAIDLQDELEYYKQREAKKAERQKMAEQKAQEEREKTSILGKYGIPDAQTFKQLQGQLAEANGGKTPTPSQVGEYYKAYNQAMFVGNVIKKVDESLLKDRDYIGKLLKLVDAFDPTEEELERTIRDSLSIQEKGNGNKPVKQPVRKPQKSGETKENKPFRKEDLFL